MSQKPVVRIGIVGLGVWGSRHAARLEDVDADLVGGVDIDPTARERFGREFGVRTYEDFEGLLDAGVDGIIVTTPNRYHEQYACRAFEAGIGVLLEKPLAHTLESAARIADAAADSTGVHMVGFKNRFLPAVEVIKGYQREGRFGDVTHVEANYVRRRGVPGRGSWFTQSAAAGGGSLVDIGVHAIDLALYLLDFPAVETVLGRTRSEFGGREDYTYLETRGSDDGPGGFDVDDSTTAMLGCADGRTVTLETAWAANREPTDEFVLRGTEAGATLDRMTGDLVVHETRTTGAPHFVDAEIETRDVNPVTAEQRAFVRAIHTEEPPTRNTIEEALTVQRVIDAIQRSSERGAAIDLDGSDTPS